MSLFTLQSRCTNPTKHPLHRPSVDQTVKSKQPPIHRLLPRIPFHVPSVQPSPVEVEHVSTSPDIATVARAWKQVTFWVGSRSTSCFRGTHLNHSPKGITAKPQRSSKGSRKCRPDLNLPNRARIERGGTPKPQRCRSETPHHPRGIVVPRRLDDQGRHLRVGGHGALQGTGPSYRGREPVGGSFRRPRAGSTNGVVAGFAPLRSNTPFIVGRHCHRRVLLSSTLK